MAPSSYPGHDEDDEMIPPAYRIGSLVVPPDGFDATFEGRPLPLTRAEISILRILVHANGRVVYSPDLARQGSDPTERTTPASQIVSKLRRKLREAGLAEPLIASSRPEGYCIRRAAEILQGRPIAPNLRGHLAGRGVDLAAKSLCIDGSPIELTNGALQVLNVLADHPGERLDVEAILAHIVGRNGRMQTRRTVESNLSLLRRILAGRAHIEAKRHLGYRLVVVEDQKS